MSGNREPLEKLLREEIGGNLTAVLERLRERADLSLPDFALRCREGKDALIQIYGFPPGGAERIAQADPAIFMRIEELELTATTRIELNTAMEGEPATWQLLEHLSTGQKATAVLLLLLLESEAPLVVDQPEDDLDNRFITEGVVPIMRDEKRRRQFVFSTHNANIWVPSMVSRCGSWSKRFWKAAEPPSKCAGLNTVFEGCDDDADRIDRTDQQR